MCVPWSAHTRREINYYAFQTTPIISPTWINYNSYSYFCNT